MDHRKLDLRFWDDYCKVSGRQLRGNETLAGAASGQLRSLTVSM